MSISIVHAFRAGFPGAPLSGAPVDARPPAGRARALGAVAVVVAALQVAPSVAQTVVELFTSQNCPTCPGADAILSELAEDSDLIILAFHVDHWDKLGWKDEFARPAFGQRQKAYEAAFGERLYTPQMVINGQRDVPGHERGRVLSELRRMRKEALPLEASLTQEAGGDLTIHVSPSEGEAASPATVWIAGFDDQRAVDIPRGANAGKRVVYRHIVRDWRRVASWAGDAPFSMSIGRPAGDGGAAVIVQQGEGGAILGAAQIKY